MNSLSMISNGAAFDEHSLDGLKRDVKSNSANGLRVAAQQLEGLFVQMMLKSMRDASLGSGAMDSQQSSMFTSMFDQQISQNIAQTGKLGFADQMVAQMGGGVHPHTATSQPYVPSTSHFNAALPHSPAHPFSLSQLVPRSVRELPETALREGGGFISRLLQPALAVARKSGIPHQLIIAQAALESGWGNREIPTQSGKPSHNLFGIKAASDWHGETTEITTTEYKHGVANKTKARFKVYPSYTAALEDYASLLVNNPRYRHVCNAVKPEAAAKALQSAGYATDPTYAHKLISIIQQVKGRAEHAVNAYNTDLSSIF
ncbi:flagellar assembly peptidoglycan hydrolase FlgJ [Escherichia sp. E3659]|uniref:flagellar assembly peptidoglycan hydrolase FlgJ n=1 Tax=Escherichia sp. E3659 TaxID=2044462 RepID=UPI001436BFB6|nr:flagellar assembly peptidoglycan hydrolase FlgJ [Escherichia sp. E3659]